MGTFIIAFQTVLPLFLVILLGLVFSRTKAASLTWVEILNNYALWIGFPALIIASLSKLELAGQSYFSFILINSSFIVFCTLLAYPVSKIFGFDNQMRRSLFIVLSFGNVSYLGIPILQNSLGDKILPVAAVLSGIYVFWLLTLALILIQVHDSKKIDLKKLVVSLVKNPLLLSVLIGILIVVFQLKIHDVLIKTINLFAESVTAVVLFSLGIFLGLQKIGKIKEWRQIFVFALVTMVVLPAFYLLIVKTFRIPLDNLDASILDAAMPLGVTPYALAVVYKLNAQFIARLIVLATLLSMVILPLWIVILSWI